MNEPDAGGLSYVQRREMEHKKELDLVMKEQNALAQLDCETAFLPCVCEIECVGETCKQKLATKKAAEEKYEKAIAEINAERYPAAAHTTTTKPAAGKAVPKKPINTKVPSTLSSKSAASLLSQPKPSTLISKPKVQPIDTKPRIPFSNISSRKQTPSPTNPSSMRHTAATLASKTTIGRSAGRATSAAYRKNAAPTKPAAEVPDMSLPPVAFMARYGEPKEGTRMWDRCLEAGLLFKEGQEEEVDLAPSLEEILMEGAEEEFVLEL